jgi:hypothetical protein
VRRYSGLDSLNGDALVLKKAFVLIGSENKAHDRDRSDILRSRFNREPGRRIANLVSFFFVEVCKTRFPELIHYL